MRIRPEETAALVIDYQERLIPVMSGKEILLKNSKRLLEGLRELKIPVYITQQYTKGLGMTVPEIAEAAGRQAYIEKICFSAYEDVKETIRDKRFVIVCGVEAHICVLQTVIDLAEAGHIPVLVTNCTASRKDLERKMAIQRAKSEGAILTTYEALLFELLQKAGSETSRAIQRLVK